MSIIYQSGAERKRNLSCLCSISRTRSGGPWRPVGQRLELPPPNENKAA